MRNFSWRVLVCVLLSLGVVQLADSRNPYGQVLNAVKKKRSSVPGTSNQPPANAEFQSLYSDMARAHRAKTVNPQTAPTNHGEAQASQLIVPRRSNGEIAVRTADQLDNLKESDCFGRFSKWSECSSTCGQGIRERTFKVLKKATGGESCELPDGYVEVKKCGNDGCFNFQSCELQDSTSAFKSIGPVQADGTRIFTNETDLLVVVPPIRNPQGSFPRLLLWKDWDAVPPSSGALPNPDIDPETHTAENDSAVGSDHMAPLAGYYDRLSLASETLLFTTSDMKRWVHQPKPRPPRAWARRQAKMEAAQSAEHNRQETVEISAQGEVKGDAHATALSTSDHISIQCVPGLVSAGDG